MLKWLKAHQLETMEAWAAEAYVGPSAEETAIANAAALGGMRVLGQIIELIEEGDANDDNEG
jgi:hypothetical protein